MSFTGTAAVGVPGAERGEEGEEAAETGDVFPLLGPVLAVSTLRFDLDGPRGVRPNASAAVVPAGKGVEVAATPMRVWLSEARASRRRLPPANGPQHTHKLSNTHTLSETQTPVPVPVLCGVH